METFLAKALHLAVFLRSSEDCGDLSTWEPLRTLRARGKHGSMELRPQSSPGTPLSRKGLRLGRHRPNLSMSLCAFVPAKWVLVLLLFLVLGSTGGVVLGWAGGSHGDGLQQYRGMRKGLCISSDSSCVSCGWNTCWVQASCQAGVLLMKLQLKSLGHSENANIWEFIFFPFSWQWVYAYKLLYQKNAGVGHIK